MPDIQERDLDLNLKRVFNPAAPLLGLDLPRLVDMQAGDTAATAAAVASATTMDAAVAATAAAGLAALAGTTLLLGSHGAQSILANPTGSTGNVIDVAAGASTILARGAAGNLAFQSAAAIKTILGIGVADVAGLAAIASSGSAADLITGFIPVARLPALTGDITTVAGAVATTLTTTGVTAAVYGDATHSPTITVDAKGRLTLAVSTAIAIDTSAVTTGTLAAARMPALTGAVTTVAGAVATTLAAGVVGNSNCANMAAGTVSSNITGAPASPADNTLAAFKTALAIAFTDVSGTIATTRVTGLAAIATSGSATDLTAGTVAAARMPAFTGDITTVAGAVATTLATTGVGAGTFGDATHVGSFQVDVKGRLLAASQVTIAIDASAITTGTLAGARIPVASGISIVGGNITGDYILGKAGGQTWVGGTGASENLTLQSTSSATKGQVLIDSVAVFASATALALLTGNAATSTPVLAVASSSSTGQAIIHFRTGTSTIRAGIRADYLGNLSFFNGWGGGSVAFDWLTGGDAGGNGGQYMTRLLQNGHFMIQAAGGSPPTDNGMMFQVSGRMGSAKGASVASATTLTLGADGNTFAITGTTTIQGIVTTNWIAGSRISLELAAGIKIAHNSGSPGASAVAIQLQRGIDLISSAACVLELVYNGTSWYQPGVVIRETEASWFVQQLDFINLLVSTLTDVIVKEECGRIGAFAFSNVSSAPTSGSQTAGPTTILVQSGTDTNGTASIRTDTFISNTRTIKWAVATRVTKIATHATVEQRLCAVSDLSAVSHYIGIIGPTSQTVFQMNINGTVVSTSTTQAAAGTYDTLILINDGTNIKAYINGTQVATTASTNASTNVGAFSAELFNGGTGTTAGFKVDKVLVVMEAAS